MFAALAFGCGSDDDANTVVVGGKDYTEQEILVFVLGELIEHKTDLEVEYENYLGGTSIVNQALHRGDVDMYVEYTGTAFD